jgi:DNA-binding response OmpR family regulator
MPVPDDDPNRTQAPYFSLLADRSAVLVAGREVVLTPVQFRLLATLMSEPGRTFTRSGLVAHLFGGSVDERTVDANIKDLRRTLEPDDAQIETVRGQGYRYRGPSI